MSTVDAPRVDAPVDDEPVEVAEATSTALGERDEYLRTLQRVQAEYDNYRRRAQRDLADQHDRGAHALAEKLLPVLDSVDAAHSHHRDVIAPVRSALLSTLTAEGLERLDPVGEQFDPAQHHAVEHLAAPDDDAAGGTDAAGVAAVEQVLRPGYRWRGRLLRPAIVTVRG